MEVNKRISSQAGFMCGAMSIPFIEWCVRNVRPDEPAAFALRGAGAFALVAEKLAIARPSVFTPVLQWKALHINRKMAMTYEYARYGDCRNRDEWGNICKYFKDNGIGTIWTMIDTGMSGCLANGLGEANPTTTLLFSHSEPDTKAIRGFINNPPHAALMKNIIAQVGGKHNAYQALTDFMEAMPHLYRSVGRCDDDGNPILSEDRDIGAASELRGDYERGLDRAVDAFVAGTLPSIETCLRELFNGHAIERYNRILRGS